MHHPLTPPVFRTGPHMGIPYEQALAAGLSSAQKGREAYAMYLTTHKTSTPSERILRGHKATFALVDDILDPSTQPFPEYPSERVKQYFMTRVYGSRMPLVGPDEEPLTAAEVEFLLGLIGPLPACSAHASSTRMYYPRRDHG